MDILYVYKDDSWNGRSLRYSLRSIAKFGGGLDRVYIVGDKPEWLSDEVTYIPCDDLPNHKAFNIIRKIKYAVDNSDIADDFLISMDDHFYVEPVDFNSYPYFAKDYIKRDCRHLLPDHIDPKWKSPDYTEVLISTRRFLEANNLPYINLTLHRNMHMNRQRLNECWPEILKTESFETDIEGICYVLNYMYSKGDFDYEVARDVKFTHKSKLELTDHVFSTEDFIPNGQIDLFLQSLFPDKCRYEKLL